MNNRPEKEAKIAVIAHLKRIAVLANETVLLSEFTANFSGVRADLAYLDTSGLHAIEIKSFADTFYRVPDQLIGYSHYFSSTVFAVAERHIENARAILPKWVGIWAIGTGSVTVVRSPRLRTIKKSKLVDMLLVRDLIKLTSGRTVSVGCRAREQLSKEAMKLSRRVLFDYTTASIHERYKKQSQEFLKCFKENCDPDSVLLLSRTHPKRTRVEAIKSARSHIWKQWERLSDSASLELSQPNHHPILQKLSFDC
jgi:hypothetical protein